MSYWESLRAASRRIPFERNWLFAEILIAVSFERALQITRAHWKFSIEIKQRKSEEENLARH